MNIKCTNILKAAAADEQNYIIKVTKLSFGYQYNRNV